MTTAADSAERAAEAAFQCPSCGESEGLLDGKCRTCGHRLAPTELVVHRPWLGVVTLAFATTVAMWAVAYVCRLPGVLAPGWLLGGGFLVCLVSGGFGAGRRLDGPVAWDGARVGGISSVLNLLILGAFLADGKAQALTWIPGTVAIGAVLGAVGAALGRKTRTAPWAPQRWVPAFVKVALVATLLLLALGGIVTGNEAGLAVPDWPTSFTANMFFYPLSRMTGGIYYEHAHRLFGSLVGLTTLAFAVVVFVEDRRGWLRALAAFAFVLVCVQGVLGGVRVTALSTTLAIVHGVTAQVFFCLLVAMAAFASDTWRSDRPRVVTGEAAEDLLSGTTWLVAAVFLQLVLGALVRHGELAFSWHVSMAVVVVVLVLVNGVRARDHADVPVVPKVGMGLIHLVLLQFALGAGALITTLVDEGAIAAAQVPFTTIHQTVGALVFGAAVLLRVWVHRFFDAAPVAPKS
jgi:cytochrome c oxidase assembly protein subunit 15